MKAKLAKVDLKGFDGKEIKANMNYESAMSPAQLSQQDCALESLIDGLE